MTSTRQAAALFVAGLCVCVLWFVAATRPAAKPATKPGPLVTRDQVVGRWVLDQPVRTIGDPMRAHVLVAFLPDGRFQQRVDLCRRDGTPTSQPAARLDGTWELAGDDVRLRIGGKDLVLLPVVDGDELSFIADGADGELAPDAALRRDLTPQPLD